MANADWLFHASRVEQIYENIVHNHILTFVATNTFQHTGEGSFLFYPALFMYPWAIFRLFLSPVCAFYLWYILIVFVDLLISYYCMKSISKNRNVSFIFACVYIFNPYRSLLGSWVFGEFIATGFLPLAFLGLYKVFFDSTKGSRNGALTLGIGMSLLIYSHILSVFITLEVFVFILMVFYFVDSRDLFLRWQELVKAILVTCVLTLPIIYLFIFDYIGKHVSSTSLGIIEYQVPTLSDIINNSFNNVNGPNIGIFLLITSFVGWYFVRKNKKLLIVYIVSLFLIICSTKIFPWQLLGNTFLGAIQLPYRYLSYSCLLLSIIAAKATILIVNKFKYVSQSKLLSVVTIIVLFFSYSLMSTQINYLRNNPGSKLNFSKKYKGKILPESVLNNVNYKDQFNYRIPWGETDYFPERSLPRQESIVDQKTFLDGSEVKPSSVKYKPNKVIYKFKSADKGKLDLPIVAYSHTYVKINGVKIRYKISSRGTTLIPKRFLKGRTLLVEAGYCPGVMYYICLTISIISWVMVIYTARKRSIDAETKV